MGDRTSKQKEKAPSRAATEGSKIYGGLSFDFAFSEIMWTLLTGMSKCVSPPPIVTIKCSTDHFYNWHIHVTDSDLHWNQCRTKLDLIPVLGEYNLNAPEKYTGTKTSLVMPHFQHRSRYIVHYKNDLYTIPFMLVSLSSQFDGGRAPPGSTSAINCRWRVLRLCMNCSPCWQITWHYC